MDHLLNIRKEYKNLKKLDNWRLDKIDMMNQKTLFKKDMAYNAYQDLERSTASDNVLRNKAFDIARNLKYNKY